MSGGLRSGTLTFVFTDIQGSTSLLHALGEGYAAQLQEHHRLLREAFGRYGGYELGTAGDAFFVTFDHATDALAACVDAQVALDRHPWPPGNAIRVRMGVHTGDAEVVGGDYVGMAVHQAARICSAAHGGQVIVSDVARALAENRFDTVPLGEHQLKDLPQPIALHQLVVPGTPDVFPPPRSLTLLSNNLPVRLTSFIGRANEVREVAKLLASHRMVSLTGSAGSGKTSLALEIAATVVDAYEHGAWFVDLAPIADASLVERAVADALGLPDAGDRQLVDALCIHLARRELVLILDNCEHLLAPCADLLSQLLTKTSSVSVLATSQAVLDLAGEVIYQVAPLDLPDTDDLDVDVAGSGAVQLFCERATRARPDFTLTADNRAAVAEICRRLDGLPLAIELAAARVRSLSPGEIARRLDQRFALLTGGGRGAAPRHQTLLAALEWTLELCTPVEQLLFRRLSTFAGSFSLEAIENVCVGEGVLEADVVDLIDGLVRRSLVIALSGEQTRYRLLETMREYGRDALRRSEEAAAVRSAHLRWFARFAADAEPRLDTSDEAVIHHQIDDDLDNLREALEWAVDADPAAGVVLATSLLCYWENRPYRREAARRLQALLPRLEPDDVATRARGLYVSEWLVVGQGSDERLGELLAMRDDPRALPWVGGGLTMKAMVHWREGDRETALRLMREARPLVAGPTGIPLLQVLLLLEGLMSLDPGEGRALCEASVALRPTSLTSRGDALFQMGRISMKEGWYSRAEAEFVESAGIWRTVGMDRWVGAAHHHLAEITYARGDAAMAWKHLDIAEEVLGRWDEENLVDVMVERAIIERDRGAFDEARRHLTEACAEVLAWDGSDDHPAVLLASIDLAEGRVASARESLDALLVRPRLTARPLALTLRCRVARHDGDPDTALRLIDEAIQTRSDPIPLCLAERASSLLASGRLHEAADDLRRAIAHETRREGSLPLLAAQLEALGQVVAGRGADTAAMLLGAADAIRERIGTAIHPVDQREHDDALERARAGDVAFAAHWAEGRQMTVSTAVALALRDDVSS